MKTSYSDNPTTTYKSPVYTTRAAAAKKKSKKTNPSDVALECPVPVSLAILEDTNRTGNLADKKDSSSSSHVAKVSKKNNNNVSANVEVGKKIDNNLQPNFAKTDTSTPHHDVFPIFLNEPFKNHTLQLDDTIIENLNGDKWLCTDLIDFLVRHGLPSWKPAYVLVPTSDVEPLLDFYNLKAKSTAPEDIEMVANHRKLYKNFTTKELRISTITVKKGLFFVIDMTFDAADADGDYFQNITIYDSLVRSNRKRGQAQLKNSYAIELFKKIQEFFYNYVIFDVKDETTELNKNKILEDISYSKCPIPQKNCDSSLYALSIVLHLVRGIRVTEYIFTQQVITYFRKSLYVVLKAPREELRANPKVHILTDFITSFFGKTFI